MHFQTDRTLDDAGLEAVEDALRRSLTGLRLAVRDFLPMVERVERMIEVAEAAGARFAPDEMHESIEFLSWLTDDNFIYLGYREYEATEVDGQAAAGIVPGSGLGLLSDEARSRYAQPVPVAELDESMRERIFGGPLVIVSKTNAETTIHRKARMDYIGVKRVDAGGEVVGELRLIGLFTSKAYAESARQIPLVRRKLESIMQWEDLIAGSHDYKAVVALFDSFPKDELFAASASELRATIMSLLGMQEEGGVRLFLRRDPVRRTVAAVVALPRDHVSTELRIRLEHLLRAAVRRARRRLHPLVRNRPGPVSLHHPRPLGRHPRPADGRAPAGGGRRSPELGRLAVGRPRRHDGSGPRARARAPVRGPLPRLLQVRGADLPGDVRRRAVRVARPRPALRRGASERAGDRRAADPPQALQDGRQGAADRPPAAPRAARPDRRRGGADPPRRNRRGRPLPARLRRARAGGQATRPRSNGGHRRRHGRCGLGGQGRVGLAEPARRHGRARLAAGHDPARLPGVPPAARCDLHLALPERLPRSERRHLTQAGAALRAPLRPGRPQGRGGRGRCSSTRSRPTWTPCRASTTIASCAGTWA